MSISTKKVTLGTSSRSNAVALLATMRPKQWIKNFLVYLPLIFTINNHWNVAEETPTIISLLLDSTLSFLSFTLASSAVYTWNDICDRLADASHPKKKFRPLASGKLSPRLAIAFAVLLSITSVIIGFLVTPWIGIIIAGYLTLMGFYSYHLKHLVLLDVILISSGYVARAVSGAIAINAPISAWLYVVTGLGALFLGFGKRKSELNKLIPSTTTTHENILEPHTQRRVLSIYTHDLLNTLISISASSLILAYMIYTFTAENLPHNNSMMATIPFVIYGVFRYILIVTEPTTEEQPEDALLNDKPVVVTAVGWILSVIAILLMFPE